MPVSVPLVVIYALAVVRLTGLITVDEITKPPREAIIRRLPESRTGIAVGYLLTCPWCTSAYVAAIAAPLVWWHGTSTWLAVPALALAFSQVAGSLAGVGRD